MTLIHLLLESNQLTGSIPDTLGLVRSLLVLHLDNNLFNGPVPQNLNNLSDVSQLYLSNNRLTGPLPNLTGMNYLNYVDMSNNTFEPTDVPSWFSSLRSLTTLILRNNCLNGTLNVSSDLSSQLYLIDLQDNRIMDFIDSVGYKFQLILVGNPYCQGLNGMYCTITPPSDSSNSTSPYNCLTSQCSSNKTSSPTCKCAYPYTGNLFFQAATFFDLSNTNNYMVLRQTMQSSFRNYKLPADSVSMSNPTKNLDSYLVLHLQIFPSSEDHFNRTGVSALGFVLSNQTYKPPLYFGPFFFIGDIYWHFEGASTSSQKSSLVLLLEQQLLVVILILLLILTGVYAFRRKKRAEIAAGKNDPFASWDPNNNSGGVPQVNGVKCFSFEELKKYTNNCSEINEIGTGGYGKVYRGTLPSGQLVAIKRAQRGSMQGALEFKTEIELLSRVHHTNVVKLVGFCFEQGEQILVYEYIPNGTLQDSLLGKSGIRLDWMGRLQIALGAARGLQYLHDLADPPIIHRDIKSNNILLDERLNVTVADFGISKPFEPERRHVTTQVKGTPGYLDPEYYMTWNLTEKSDVYSFGVLLLELMTARNPINIVKEVRQMIDKSKDLYNLHSILGTNLGLSMPPRSLEKFVDLAMRCVKEAGLNRPTMGDAVKEIENIMELAGLNLDAESAPILACNEGISKEYSHHSTESLFASNVAHPSSKLERE